MSTTAERPDYLDDQQHLHRLGYAQELFRSMGGFQNFAISFTIISILAGCLTSYAIAFNQGGPVAITYDVRQPARIEMIVNEMAKF